MTPDYALSLLRSFERHLRAENRSDNTIESYLENRARGGTRGAAAKRAPRAPAPLRDVGVPPASPLGRTQTPREGMP